MKTLLTLLLTVALAQTAPEPLRADEAIAIPGQSPGIPPAETVVDDLAREIGLGLRCPVCQGLSVSDSTSSAAVMMQRRIHELVAAGYTREQIEGYFVSKYGEWVLLAPPAAGLNQIVWLGPFVGILIAAAIAARLTRRPETDEGPDTVVDDEVSPSLQKGDPRLERLLREVDDD